MLQSKQDEMEEALAAKCATLAKVEHLLEESRQLMRAEESAHTKTYAELKACHRRVERLEGEMLAVTAEASAVRACLFKEVRKADASLAAAEEAGAQAAGRAEAELAVCTRRVMGAEITEVEAHLAYFGKTLQDVTVELGAVRDAAAAAAERVLAAAQRRAIEAESSCGEFRDGSLRVLYKRMTDDAAAAVAAATEEATAQCRAALAALADEKAAHQAFRDIFETAEERVAAERGRAAAADHSERAARNAAAAAVAKCAAAAARADEIESRLGEATDDADKARVALARFVMSLESKLDAVVSGESSLEGMVGGAIAALQNHEQQARFPARSSRPTSLLLAFRPIPNPPPTSPAHSAFGRDRWKQWLGGQLRRLKVIKRRRATPARSSRPIAVLPVHRLLPLVQFTARLHPRILVKAAVLRFMLEPSRIGTHTPLL
jgi:hypothetical protein